MCLVLFRYCVARRGRPPGQRHHTSARVSSATPALALFPTWLRLTPVSTIYVTAPQVGNKPPRGSSSLSRHSSVDVIDSSSALQKIDPALKVAAMKAFATGQRMVIKAFCSWKVYMGALNADKKAPALIRKAAWSWDFYLTEARDFGIKVKLDRIDGLIEHASVHEWLAPAERHERNMRRRLISVSNSAPPGASQHLKAAAADDDSSSSSDDDDGDNGKEPPAAIAEDGDAAEEDDVFVAPTRGKMSRSSSFASSGASIPGDHGGATGSTSSPKRRPPRSVSMSAMSTTSSKNYYKKKELSPSAKGAGVWATQEEWTSEEEESKGGIRWSSAEKDLMGSIFPGALS